MLINQDKLNPAECQAQAELEEIDERTLEAMKKASLPTTEQNGNENPVASTVVSIVTPTKSPASAAKTQEEMIEEVLKQTDLAVEEARANDWERHAAGYDNEEEDDEMPALEETNPNESTDKPPAAAATKPAAMSTEGEDPANGIANFIKAADGTVGKTHAFSFLLYIYRLILTHP